MTCRSERGASGTPRNEAWQAGETASTKSDNKNMNYINSVVAENFKGRSFAEDLGGVTLFTGPTRSGKTARLEAVQLALTGELPGVEKTPAKVYARLASGQAMVVGVGFFATGAQQSRVWKDNGGKVSALVVADRQVDVPAEALDAQSFLDLGPTERTKRLARLSGVGQADIVDRVVESYQDVRELDLEDLELEAVTEKVRAARLLAEAEGKRQRQAVQAFVSRQGSLPPHDPGAEAKLTAAKKALESAQTEDAQAAAALGSAAELVGKAVRAKEEVEESKEALENQAAWRAKLAELEAAEPPDPGKGNLKAGVQAQERLVEEFQDNYEDLKADIGKLEKELEDCGKASTCPTCGQKVKASKGSAFVKARLEQRLAELKTEESKVMERLAKARGGLARLSKSAEAHAQAREKRDQWENQVALARQLASKGAVPPVQTQELAATLPALSAELDRVKLVRLRTLGQLEAAKADLRAAEAAYKALVEHRARLAEYGKSVKAAGEAEARAGRLKAAEAELKGAAAESAEAGARQFLGAVNRVFKAEVGRPLEFQDGEFGLTCGGRFYSHRTFSGSESAALRCSLATALAGDSPKLLFVDELNRLGDDKVEFVREVCRLVKAGLLDQVFMTDCYPWPPGLCFEGLKVVRLSREGSAHTNAPQPPL